MNPNAIARAQQLIDSHQYVLDNDWGQVQPGASAENAFLESHSRQEYAQWHLGLIEGASDGTKARYAFVSTETSAVHRLGIIACHYRAAQRRHTLYLYSERRTVKARNLAADPRVAVHLESGENVMIVRGIADDVGTPAQVPGVVAALSAKYTNDGDHRYLPGRRQTLYGRSGNRPRC